MEHYTVQPKKEECIKLLERHGIKDNMMRHALMVNAVAVLLGQMLVDKQELIDLQVLDRASLLHDIFKLKDKPFHAEKGADLLFNMGYPDIALAIRNHRIDFILKNKFNNWEELLVFYADKRVEGDRIVSIDERIDSLKKRHPEHAENMEKTREPIKELESQIFKHLNFRPEQLAEKIRG